MHRVDEEEVNFAENFHEYHGETIEEAISLCDVVVGSYSNAVLEALLQLKPLVFFRTQKWGDYFEIKSLDAQGYFFAENPEELIEKIKKSTNILKEDLKKLQKQFFGNPYQNGSKWVVDQVIKNLLAKSSFK